jgi:type IV pilus assembly protein PilA
MRVGKLCPSVSPRGFTLIELMVVVAIIGVLAVLAVFGVSRYINSSKASEALNNLGAISKNASESLMREPMIGSFVAPGQKVNTYHCICGTATNTVPASAASIKGKKYVSDPLQDWRQAGSITTESNIGWRCLRYSIDYPQYFMYSYTESSASCTSGSITGDVVHAIANGDLNGNGILSTFDLQGQVNTGQTQLTWAPVPLATLPQE